MSSVVNKQSLPTSVTWDWVQLLGSLTQDGRMSVFRSEIVFGYHAQPSRAKTECWTGRQKYDTFKYFPWGYFKRELFNFCLWCKQIFAFLLGSKTGHFSLVSLSLSPYKCLAFLGYNYDYKRGISPAVVLLLTVWKYLIPYSVCILPWRVVAVGPESLQIKYPSVLHKTSWQRICDTRLKMSISLLFSWLPDGLISIKYVFL